MEDRQFDDGWVSRNFREHELACPCCGKYIHNQRLILSLEKLRRLAGNVPVSITSGTRCRDYNDSVGGVDQSRHLTGEAADVVVQGLHPEEIHTLISAIEPFSHGGVGTYSSFTHLDVRYGGPARWHG